MKNKKTIIVVVVIILVIGVFLFSISKKSGSDSPQDHTSAKELIPSKEVTHGHGLAVDVSDPSKLYIATHHGLFVLKNDINLYQVGANNNDYMGFSPDGTNAKVFYASGHPETGGSIGYQMSDDGGFTWRQISEGSDGPVDFHAMSVSPVNSKLVFGWFQGNLQRSEDGGNTWQKFRTGFVTTHLIADPKDVNTVYATTPQQQAVLVSHDKGRTWNPLSEDLLGGIASSFAINPNDTSMMLVFAEKLGGLGKSNDKGKTWTKINETFNGEEILFLAYAPTNPSIVYGLTEKNSIYKSTDSGNTWKKIR